MFAEDVILYKENLKSASKNLLELMNEFGEDEGYKINIQKSVVFLYTNNKLPEREIKPTIPFFFFSFPFFFKYIYIYIFCSEFCHTLK